MGVRCTGFISEDLQWVECSREEFGKGCSFHEDSKTYTHRLGAHCHCGETHTPYGGEGKTHTNGHSKTPPPQERREAASFDYRDEHGNLKYQNVRAEPKYFFLRHVCPDGKVTRGMGEKPSLCECPKVLPILYKLPELLIADPSLMVYITEGEAHADRLWELGLVATSFCMGAEKSHLTQNVSVLKDRSVVILPDIDQAGHRHAQKAAQQLQGVAHSIKVLQLPGMQGLKFNAKGEDKSDILDWLNAGHLVSELVELATDCPEWGPDGSPNDLSKWPAPMAEEAFHGLAGEVVAALLPHTESCREALLLQFLAAFGNAAGRNPHGRAEAAQHGTNIYTVLVGNTAKARKGSAWGHIRELFQQADPEWLENRVTGGLSSGEGLVWEVRDPVEKLVRDRETKQYVKEIVDEGVVDKRLLIVEPEFSSVIQVMSRERNTLSAVLRQGWDSQTLKTMTKQNAAKATDPHITLIGHITKDELLRHLNEGEAANGFGNRFLWACTHRTKRLPEGGGIPDYAHLAPQLKAAIERAKSIGLLVRDEPTREAWAAIYDDLSQEHPGLFGGMIARAEAQCLRLSVLYAALDGDTAIRYQHLKAAIAVWEYCEASARYIFGDATGDPIADRLLDALAQGELDRTDMHYLFGKNVPAPRISQALMMLRSLGRIRMERRAGEGPKPREVWMLAD
jgi:hypothetical protein